MKNEKHIENLRSVIGCLLDFVESQHDGAHAECQVCLDVKSAREVLQVEREGGLK